MSQNKLNAKPEDNRKQQRQQWIDAVENLSRDAVLKQRLELVERQAAMSNREGLWMH